MHAYGFARRSHLGGPGCAVVEIGRRLGCRAFNGLYGNRVDGVDAESADAQATTMLGEAAAALEIARRRGVHHLALGPAAVRHPRREPDGAATMTR